MHAKVIWQICALFLIVMIQGCSHRNIKELEKEIMNTSVSIPWDSLEELTPVRPFIQNSDSNPDFRYIVYFDTTECAPCQLHKMGIWHSVMKHTQEIGVKVNFLYIFHPSSPQVAIIRDDFYQQKISLRIIIDSIGITERINPILKKGKSYHAFLIDSNNHIVAVGNAGNDAHAEHRYYELLRKVKNRNDTL